jgi:hypothetical protein
VTWQDGHAVNSSVQSVETSFFRRRNLTFAGNESVINSPLPVKTSLLRSCLRRSLTFGRTILTFLLLENLRTTCSYPCAENISSCGRASCIMICEGCRKLLTRWPETCLKDLNKRRINNKDEDFKASVVVASFVFDQSADHTKPVKRPLGRGRISKRPRRAGICTYLIFVGFPLARAVGGQTGRNPGGPTAISLMHAEDQPNLVMRSPWSTTITTGRVVEVRSPTLAQNSSSFSCFR